MQDARGVRRIVHLIRPGNAQSMQAVLSTAEAAPPTYVERGATLAGPLPAGYHHLEEEAVLGRGRDVFTSASNGLRTWQAHHFMGVRVFPIDAPLAAGTTVVVSLGPRFGAIAAPCRVIAVVDEPRRFGFAYGTLPGHPEQGEESFVASIADDDTVRFAIKAFSRHGDPLTRISGPLGHKMQSLATHGYIRSLKRYVERSIPA